MLKPEARECGPIPRVWSPGKDGIKVVSEEGVITMARKTMKKSNQKSIRKVEPKRNTAMPKIAPQARSNQGTQARQPSQQSGGKTITQEMIAKRAFEIYKSGKG